MSNTATFDLAIPRHFLESLAVRRVPLSFSAEPDANLIVTTLVYNSNVARAGGLKL